MDSELWKIIYQGTGVVAAHAVLAAAIKHSLLLGDFLDLVVRQQYHLLNPALSNRLWDDYLSDCRGQDPEMPEGNESTRRRLRSSVFQILAQASFIESTKTLKLRPVHIAPQVLRYLTNRKEEYVLRCIQRRSPPTFLADPGMRKQIRLATQRQRQPRKVEQQFHCERVRQNEPQLSLERSLTPV